MNRHEHTLRTARLVVVALLSISGAFAPALADPPPATVTDVQPFDGLANRVLVERTEGEFDGDPDGWRMNVDVWVRNGGAADLVLETVEISYDGGSNPGTTIVDVDFFTLFTGRGVIPENEDEGLAANEIEGGDTRIVIVPEQRVLPFPLPDDVTIDLYFEGFDDPITVTRDLRVYDSGAPLDSYAFPGARKDLPQGQYWTVGTGHTYRSHHRPVPAQRFAEDWGVSRWDGSDWTHLVPGGDSGNNDDFLIWDMPVYAIADGEVTRCGNGFRDNPNPPDKLDGVTDDPPTIPGGGNHLWIQHTRGERVLYAHFRRGTIPESLCPADASLGAHDLATPVFVPAGTYLGRVGNSGNSSGPHLHIHSEASGEGIPLYYHNARSFVREYYDPNVDPAPPWNDVEDAAISSHAPFPGVGAFAQPGRRANAGILKYFSPSPAVAGTNVVATIEVTNHGPDAATGLEIVDEIPSELTYLFDTGSCVEAPSGTLTCDVGALQALEADGHEDATSRQITMSIPADLVHDNGGPAIVGSTATVSGDRFDDSADDDFDFSSVRVIAKSDLSMKSVEVASAPSDTIFDRTVTVTVRAVVSSAGPSSPMDTRVAWHAGAGAIPSTSYTAVPALVHGEEREVEGGFLVDCPGPGLHTVDLHASVWPDSADDEDPDLTDNEGTTSLTIDCVVPVAINVKPGSYPNSIRYDKGLVSIAVLTTEAGEYGLPLDFDALTIDPHSVRFGEETRVWTGAGGAAERHKDGHPEYSVELDDVTRDADVDMVLDFLSAETGLIPSSTEACAKGRFEVEGESFTFFGCDSVRVVDHP